MRKARSIYHLSAEPEQYTNPQRRSPGYHFSGVYNVSLTVTDSGLGLVPPSAIQAYGRVNVTGGTPVFTVLTVVNTQNATVGFPVKVTSSITYSNAYPSGLGFRSVLFSYTIKWGDGTSSVVRIPGSSLPTLPRPVTTTQSPGAIPSRSSPQTVKPPKLGRAVLQALVLQVLSQGTSVSPRRPLLQVSR